MIRVVKKERTHQTSSASDEVARLQKVAYILHAVFNGSIQATMDEDQQVDWEKIVTGISRFMRCCKYLKPESEEPEDMMAELEKAGIIQGTQLSREGDRIVIKIQKCLMTGGKEGVHRLTCPIDVPCPIAFFLGANIALKNRPKKLMVHHTIFHEEGSTTEMELLPPQKYKQRLESLRLMKTMKK